MNNCIDKQIYKIEMNRCQSDLRLLLSSVGHCYKNVFRIGTTFTIVATLDAVKQSVPADACSEEARS